MKRIRSLFQAEWTWRLFLVLTVAGIVGAVWLDLSERRWSFLPSEFRTAYVETALTRSIKAECWEKTELAEENYRARHAADRKRYEKLLTARLAGEPLSEPDQTWFDYEAKWGHGRSWGRSHPYHNAERDGDRIMCGAQPLPIKAETGERYYWIVPAFPHEWGLTSRHWGQHGSYHNWLFLAFLFGPFAIAKSLDWIVSAAPSKGAGRKGR